MPCVYALWGLMWVPFMFGVVYIRWLGLLGLDEVVPMGTMVKGWKIKAVTGTMARRREWKTISAARPLWAAADRRAAVAAWRGAGEGPDAAGAPLSPLPHLSRG